MRMRNKPWASDFLAQHPLVSIDPKDQKGLWKSNYQSVILEIGSGKGQYIFDLAKLHPENRYIALEKDRNVSATALRFHEALDLKNLIWINNGAEAIETWFSTGELNELHLNFSDPWPKKHHEKRRLTSKTFMPVFLGLLSEKGVIKFKTDNQKLFEYTIMQMQQYPLDMIFFSVNYIHTPEEEDAYTEYEMKFNALNQPIYRAVWRKK